MTFREDMREALAPVVRAKRAAEAGDASLPFHHHGELVRQKVHMALQAQVIHFIPYLPLDAVEIALHETGGRPGRDLWQIMTDAKQKPVYEVEVVVRLRYPLEEFEQEPVKLEANIEVQDHTGEQLERLRDALVSQVGLPAEFVSGPCRHEGHSVEDCDARDVVDL